MLIHNDSDVEAEQDRWWSLSSATATLGVNRITTLTILDDEQVVTFGAAAYAVTEGGASVSLAIPDPSRRAHPGRHDRHLPERGPAARRSPTSTIAP